MEEKEFKSGFVAIVGRPNVGKSTLLNALLNDKVSIVSKIPQTTRHLVKGVLNLLDAQIVFLDSPGIHMFKDTLAQHLNVIAKKSLVDTELVLYVVDISRPPAREEERIMDVLLQQQRKIIMVFNKIDLSRNFLKEYAEVWSAKVEAKEMKADPVIACIPIAAKTGKNLNALIKEIKKELPFGPPFYDTETATDFPIKYRIADVVREKLFLKLKEEIPHSVAVETREIEDKGKCIHVHVFIYVNRVSQKKIIIGQGGDFLKIVGTQARFDIEKILKKKVYLEILVKIVPDWQNKIRILQELGYGWE